MIDIVPMNSNAATNESPIRTLLGRGTKQSREPRERCGDAGTVHEGDDQLVVGAFNVDSIIHEACASAGAGGLIPCSAATCKAPSSAS